jgi:YggT family protein
VVVWSVLATLLTVLLVLLVLRLIFEYVFLLARSFRPSGLVAMLLELIYTVTDPPLKALRRVLPPLRIGAVSLDLAFLVLFIVVTVLRSVTGNAAS